MHFQALSGPGSTTYIFTLMKERTGRIYPGSRALAFQRSQLLTNCEPWKGIYPWRCSQNITRVTSSHKYNIIKSRKSLKRSILHGLSKTTSEKSDTLRIIEVQIFKCWDVKCCNATNAKPSTLFWPLDDKNIQFPTVSSKCNSIVTLAHRSFYPCWIWAQMMTSSAQFLGYNSWRNELI